MQELSSCGGGGVGSVCGVGGCQYMDVLCVVCFKAFFGILQFG